MKRTFSLLFLLLYIAFGVKSQEQKIPAFITDSLDAYIIKAMAEWQIPALAVGIVKNGEIVYEKGFGTKKLGEGESVNVNTLFMIGSNTKAFTATAMAMLEQQGKCSLNDKVIKWLPQFTLKDPACTKEANLTDLLSHRMGFETFQGDLLSFDSDLSKKEYIEKLGKITPVYDFRTKWGYSNAGFMLAGECIESITKITWDNYIQQNILNPLHMENTTLRVDGIRESENATYAHTQINGKLTRIDYGGLDLVGPAASMSASISDMDKWTLALLDSGNVDGKNVIPFAAIQRTRKPESIKGFGRTAYNKSNYLLYGLGWELTDYETRKIVMHTGGVHGYLTSVALVPEEDLGVVVLTNTDQNWLFLALRWEIIDAFLELPYRNYSDNWVKAFRRNAAQDSLQIAQWNDSVKMEFEPELSITDFEGTYENEVYGNAKLVAKGKTLELTLEHHPDVTGKLEYIGNHRFLYTYSNNTFGTKVFPFNFNKNGAKSFVLSVNDFWEFTTYTFIKTK